MSRRKTFVDRAKEIACKLGALQDRAREFQAAYQTGQNISYTTERLAEAAAEFTGAIQSASVRKVK